MQYYHSKGEAVYREGAKLKPIWAECISAEDDRRLATCVRVLRGHHEKSMGSVARQIQLCEVNVGVMLCPSWRVLMIPCRAA